MAQHGERDTGDLAAVREPASSRTIRPDLPVSLVLSGGGIRGLAHLGVIEEVSAAGYRIEEMVGSSVGALVTAFYAVVGLDVPAMREAGLAIATRHLLVWALQRRLPAWLQKRWQTGTGIIPEYLDRLADASFDRLHHGVRRVGIVAYDVIGHNDVVCHSDDPILPVADIVHGSAAIPFLFPARDCKIGTRELRLIDGGPLLPVELIFSPPFQPRQIVIVDVSTSASDRRAHARRIEALRGSHPTIPMEVIHPARLGRRTVVYRSAGLAELVESGRRAARAFTAAQA